MKEELEGRIREWRNFLRKHRGIQDADVDELEDHLRGQIAGLVSSGLSLDEAFLVAVKRIGRLDLLSREFALEYTERLWKQLVLPRDDSKSPGLRPEVFVVVTLAIAAALAIKVPELFGLRLTDDEDMGFYARNMSLFVLPFLAAYFAWKRNLGKGYWSLAIPFLAAAVLVNVYPFRSSGDTEILIAMHLPISLWLVIALAYTGERWSSEGGRMDFVRYSGELFIYYVLIALGGGVLTAFTIGIFGSIGMEAESLATQWILPCGALGAVLVGSWLVEAKQSVIENMAPVLTRLFTPLFTLVMLAFLLTMTITGQAIDMERDVLIGFDLLLVLVLGLLLYSVSARDPLAPPGFFDWLQMLMVFSALIIDMMALAAIAARISEWGFTPNRTAALGENLILVVNLTWSAVLYWRFLTGRGNFQALVGWQTVYLPVYSIWAAVVVVAFGPLFGFA